MDEKVFFVCLTFEYLFDAFFFQRNPEMQRRFFEINPVGNVTWSRRETNFAEKLERRQRRMRIMLSGEEGESHFIIDCVHFAVVVFGRTIPLFLFNY